MFKLSNPLSLLLNGCCILELSNASFSRTREQGEFDQMEYTEVVIEILGCSCLDSFAWARCVYPKGRVLSTLILPLPGYRTPWLVDYPRRKGLSDREHLIPTHHMDETRQLRNANIGQLFAIGDVSQCVYLGQDLAKKGENSSYNVDHAKIEQEMWPRLPLVNKRQAEENEICSLHFECQQV